MTWRYRSTSIKRSTSTVPRSQTVVSTGDTLRWVLVFAGATMVLTAILLAMLADGQARSALLGGGIALLANGYSVWRIFSAPAETSGEAALANLYRAEFGKLVVIAEDPIGHRLAVQGPVVGNNVIAPTFDHGGEHGRTGLLNLSHDGVSVE